jgi:hypothetical protein
VEQEPYEDEEDVLVEILSASGFHIVPLKTIIDALSEMEEYLKDEAGISQEELEEYLKRIEELVGKEESLKLELGDILSWIRAFQSS